MPITWRNVSGPSLADAARPLEVAQRTFTAGFNFLRDVLQQSEAINAANAVARTQNNTNSYLDQLYNLGQSPEQLQEAMKSGAVQKLRAGFGNEIDANRVRGAAENLLTQRYQQVSQANQYQDAERDRMEAPIMDQIASLTAQGKRAEAAALLEQHNLRKEAGLYAGLDARGQVEVERERATKEFGWKGEEHTWKGKELEDRLATNAAQRAAAAAAREASNEARKFAREDRAQAREDRVIQVKSALRKELGDSYGAAIDSPTGLDKIQGALKNLPEGARPLAMEALREYQKTKGATLGGAIATIMATEEPSWYWPNGGIRKRAVDAGIAAGTSEAAIARQEQEEVRREPILKDLARLEGTGKQSNAPVPTTNPMYPSEAEAEQALANVRAAVAKKYPTVEDTPVVSAPVIAATPQQLGARMAAQVREAQLQQQARGRSVQEAAARREAEEQRAADMKRMRMLELQVRAKENLTKMTPSAARTLEQQRAALLELQQRLR